jgi:hypothetical protein
MIVVPQAPLQWLPSLLQERFIVQVDNLSLVLTNESNTLCRIQRMTHFWCQLLLTDTKDPSLLPTVTMQLIQKSPLLEVSQIIFGVGRWKPADTKDGSLVSATLSQPTPFKRYRFKL